VSEPNATPAGVEPEALRLLLTTKFAEAVQLAPEVIFPPDLTLTAILSASDRLHNSVDLMEALAKAVNAARRELGVKLRLRAFTMDTPISRVVESLLTQAHASSQGE
jgi:hypothetical protein